MKIPGSTITSRVQPLAIACFAACLITGASAAPLGTTNPPPSGGGQSGGGKEEEEGVFNEFAGSYTGTLFLTSFGVSAAGRAEGSVRGAKVGGDLKLRSTVSANGSTLTITRGLKFKRRSFKSTTVLVGGGLVQSGNGGGRYSDKPNFIRYSEITNITTNGMTQPVAITGKVNFFRRSIRVTESWAVSGQPGGLAFNYNLRPR